MIEDEELTEGDDMMGDDLRLEVGELRLRNPTMLAAGILGLTGASLSRVWKSGAGAVVTKTIGPRERKGYPGPTVVETPAGIINAMGLPNPGMENAVEEIEIAKESGATVIGSVFGKNRKEFLSTARRMEGAGVDVIELNLSCPHFETLLTIGHSPELTGKIVEISKSLEVPVWVKLPGSSDLSNLLQVAESAENSGAEALVLVNTVPAMAIDIEVQRLILGHGTGGLSGPAIKPIGLRMVYEVYEKMEIPIIGVGGIQNGKDAIEYLLAGASAVGIGTGIMRGGLEIFKEVCDYIRSYMEEKGLERVQDITGLAH